MAGERENELEPTREPGHELGREAGGAGYFASAVEHGEPAGVWLGHGMDGLGLGAAAGDVALDDDVRAVFGQLRRPGSPESDPDYIGSKPREYAGGAQRLAVLQAKEPEATPERLRELELQAATSGRKGVAYYDFTFSPAKSVSVYYAALLAAGLGEQAAAVRAAHDEAVRIAIAYAEQHVAYTRLDGEFVKATGLSVVGFVHHTSRESEPQLHTHAAVLNRLATADGRIGALDSKGIRAIKEAIATAYERAVEQLVGEATGAVFELRPDGVAREIAGVDPQLCTEASTRRGQVTDRVAELIATFRERHGREPDAAARKAISQAATLQTRRPKDELAGPAGVAAWGAARREWCEAVIDQVDAAAVLATPGPGFGHPATPGHQPAPEAAMTGQELTGEERLAAAVAAGVADIQATYATWTVGNLVDAVDRHLGDAAALGVSAAERPTVLEGLARGALAPGAGVVALTGHEPIPVPDTLRRTGPGQDGRPRFRPHIDERYATADQLALEGRVVALAHTPGAPQLEPHQRERVAARLDAMGLSQDQRAAVLGVLSSGGRGDVLIGPAGAGKSRVVGALAALWGDEIAAGQVGGRVFGVATSQIATANLAGDGLTAINTSRFLATFAADPMTGQAREQLAAGDLVVIDEAGMSASAELHAITGLVAAAGGKVLFTGDPAQLDAVGAGGLFAHLAQQLPHHQPPAGQPAEHAAPSDRLGQVFELDQVHRFVHEWEREASLLLRAGDHTAVAEYGDRGRLRTGTLEEMGEAAARGYLADTLSGRSSLLIVGTNQHATDLSDHIRTQLIRLGQVDRTPLFTLHDDNKVSVGDVIQARRNDRRLRVDPGPDGTGAQVTNRETYTVLGLDRAGNLLARDASGAVAHLTREYVTEHVTLGYAVTTHAAQGVTVDVGRPVLDRGASREAAYVGATRGRENNVLYLVTEREPDAHDPERVEELAAGTALGDPGLQRRPDRGDRGAGHRRGGGFVGAGVGGPVRGRHRLGGPGTPRTAPGCGARGAGRRAARRRRAGAGTTAARAARRGARRARHRSPARGGRHRPTRSRVGGVGRRRAALAAARRRARPHPRTQHPGPERGPRPRGAGRRGRSSGVGGAGAGRGGRADRRVPARGGRAARCPPGRAR